MVLIRTIGGGNLRDTRHPPSRSHVGFFDRFKSREVETEHPVLGTLRYKSHTWRGHVVLTGLPPAELWLPGDESGPHPAAAAVAAELRAKWPTLQARLTIELFEHYTPYRESIAAESPSDDDGEFPLMHHSSEVWDHVHEPLVRVVMVGATPEIRLALSTEWDVEHTVGFSIRDWTLHDVSGSVLRDSF